MTELETEHAAVAPVSFVLLIAFLLDGKQLKHSLSCLDGALRCRWLAAWENAGSHEGGHRTLTLQQRSIYAAWCRKSLAWCYVLARQATVTQSHS